MTLPRIIRNKQIDHGWEPSQPQKDFIMHCLYSNYEEVVLLGGRGGGKDLAISTVVIDYCMANPGVKVLFVAPFYKQIQNFWDQVLRARNRVKDDPLNGYYFCPQVFTINESKKEVKFKNGSVISCASADNPESIDSTRSDMIVINEAKFINKESQMNSILGTLREHGKIIWVSSAGGKNNFYEKYVSGLKDKNDPYYVASKAHDSVISFKVTYHNNPKQASNLKTLKRTMTSAMWKSQMEGEFIDESSVFIDLDKAFFISNYLSDSEYDQERWQGELPIKEIKQLKKNEKNIDVMITIPEHKYVMGVDIAKTKDYTVIYVMDIETGKIVYYERFNKMSYTLVAKKVADIAHLYNDAVISYDATGVGVAFGDALNSQIVTNNDYRRLVTYPQTFTNLFKAEIIQTLGLRIETPNSFQNFIPDIPTIINEMRNLQGELTKTGLITYNAPDGSHDDTVMALALCNYIWEQMRVTHGFEEVNLW